MKIILYDTNIELCKEWKKQFKNNKKIEIKNIAFNDLESDYVVTAGNSYGLMTGGLDSAVRNYYGQKIQDFLQVRIISEFHGFLPVGDNILIDTNDDKKKFLIYAPTMIVPSKISLSDILYVFLRILEDYDKEIGDYTLACCGLGTLTGGISPKDCARMMKKAYDIYIENNKNNKKWEMKIWH